MGPPLGGRRTSAFGSALCFVLLVAGCKGDVHASDDEAARCPVPADARGSTACHEWQAEFCDYAVRCGGGDHCKCMEVMSSIECTSDAVATQCAAAYPAGCTGAAIPAECSIDRVADRVVAQEACEAFVDAYCAANERCFGTPAATCVQSKLGTGEGQLNCTRAIGIKPWADDCFAAIDVVSCDVTELPPSCVDVIVVY